MCSIRWCMLIACLILQSILVCYMGQFSTLLTLFTWGVFIASTVAVIKRDTDHPYNFFWKHALAMFAYGNLGMLIGWMADYNFGAILGDNLCVNVNPQGTGIHISWMHVGMTIGSMPIVVFNQTKYWRIHIFFCLFGMLVGMECVSYLLGYIQISDSSYQFGLTFLLMILGMMLGMYIGCWFLRLLQISKN